MTSFESNLEEFWGNILSKDPTRIQQAFASLDAESRQAVLVHLKRMVSEEGWHPLQRESAQAALDVLFPPTRV